MDAEPVARLRLCQVEKCLPCLRSLQTGDYESKHGQMEDPDDPDSPKLGQKIARSPDARNRGSGKRVPASQVMTSSPSLVIT